MKKYNFTISGNKYEVEVGDVKGNTMNVEVNGTQFVVELDREVAAAKTPVLKRAPIKTHKVIKSEPKVTTFQVKSPLPGNIMQVFVKNGDVVKTGDKLLIYEAMKMENTITADRDGTIKGLSIQPGDTVLQDVTIMEIV